MNASVRCRFWKLLAFSLACVACDSHEHEKSIQADAGNDARDASIDWAKIDSESLDALDDETLRAICEQETVHLDPCLEVALKSGSSPSSCEQALSECRDAFDASSAADHCTNVTTASLGECPITVHQYFACLDAWAQELTCDRVGYLISTPAPCQAVVDGCAALAQDFSIYGKPPACTPEESADRPVDTNDDIYGQDGCRPPVTRFIVLGDSIADCTGVESAQCAPYIIANALRLMGAPDLQFEMHAVAGSKVSDLLAQAQQVTGGPGHVFVWMYAIGNDWLSGAPLSGDFSPYVAGYQDVFNYFTDSMSFPDGATFLLNTQYGLYDQCTVPGAKLPPILISDAGPDLLVEGNRIIFLDVAKARTDTVAVDQYPDFLGHGLNADISGCPYCGPDNATWLDGTIHPNVLGHAHIAEKWILALQSMTGPSCAPSDGGDAGFDAGVRSDGGDAGVP